MTLHTNSRLAGVAYLVYIAAGIGSMAVASRAELVAVANLITALCALTLGVTLWALTRDVDRDLAMFAMLCRLLEAAPGPGEIYFAIGNTVFCWLLWRGRLIPAALAGLGTVSSLGLSMLIVVQTAGLMGGRMQWSSPITWLVWLPLLIFELAFAVLLLSRPSSLRVAR